MGSGVLLIVIALGFGPLFLQDQPMLDATPPPSAQDVAATRRLVHDIRAAADAPDDAGGLLRTDVVQLNSAIRLGARFIDGFRGRITVEGDEVLGAFSVPVSWWSGRKWLNVSGRVPEFDGRFVLSEVTIGSTRVPPALALSLARVGANLGLGNRIGDTALQAATAMAITGAGEGAALSFRIALNDVGKNGVMRGAFGALRGAQMPTQDEVETYHLLIRAAMEKGRLPQTGSFLPYLHFTLDAVLNRTTSDALPHAYTAAVLGLAKACGAADFSAIVGRLVFDTQEIPETWASSCDAVTFNGRIDSRRHFITSAALQAASNTGFSVSVGEFKELYDTISGAGGFDFTDLAANLSGIRMSNVLMARPAEAWPALIARLQEENDVIVTFDGIPQIMSEASFKARFGDVDSVAYRETLTRIEARISQLGLYQAE
jgi:hypothetical protein